MSTSHFFQIENKRDGDGGSRIRRPESERGANEHAGARLENGGLASLALVRAGQGIATVRKRINREQKKEA